MSRITFIGLGIMGGPMAANLARGPAGGVPPRV
jgi:3-hydroxyisobutyrate dehydrogenase-like beta-hydroxyacid dehydrogenase